jgi:hypothetical protein
MKRIIVESEQDGRHIRNDDNFVETDTLITAWGTSWPCPSFHPWVGGDRQPVSRPGPGGRINNAHQFMSHTGSIPATTGYFIQFYVMLVVYIYRQWNRLWLVCLMLRCYNVTESPRPLARPPTPRVPRPSVYKQVDFWKPSISRDAHTSICQPKTCERCSGSYLPKPTGDFSSLYRDLISSSTWWWHGCEMHVSGWMTDIV